MVPKSDRVALAAVIVHRIVREPDLMKMPPRWFQEL